MRVSFCLGMMEPYLCGAENSHIASNNNSPF